MIALNELIKDFEKYNSKYKLMGHNINLNSFIRLENKLHISGQKFEQSRSNCNKLCGELIKKQSNNIDTKSELAEIVKLDKMTLKLQSKFNRLNNLINKKLNKLPNLPDENNITNLQISSSTTSSTIKNFKDFIENLVKTSSSNQKIKSFIKSESNKLFEEDDLPQITYCTDGINIFATKGSVDQLFDSILNYFKNNSISIIKVSIKNLNKSSTSEYFIHINQKSYLKLELKREFFSRKYKIKYHDKASDMTKFVNQINIYY